MKKIKLEPTVFQCALCFMELKTRVTMIRHWRAVHRLYAPLKNIPCHYCPKLFSYKTSRRRHMIAAHKLEARTEICAEKVKCSYCNKKYGNHQSLNAHLRKAHQDEKKKEFRCLVCLIVFESYASYSEHINENHKNFVELPTEKKYWACAICPKLFASREGKWAHEKKCKTRSECDTKVNIPFETASTEALQIRLSLQKEDQCSTIVQLDDDDEEYSQYHEVSTTFPSKSQHISEDQIINTEKPDSSTAEIPSVISFTSQRLLPFMALKSCDVDTFEKAVQVLELGKEMVRKEREEKQRIQKQFHRLKAKYLLLRNQLVASKFEQ